MNNEQILRKFNFSIDNNQEEEVKILLKNYGDTIQPELALHENEQIVYWATLIEHPLSICIDKGYLSLLKTLLDFIIEQKLENYKKKYNNEKITNTETIITINTSNFNNNPELFSDAEIDSLKAIFETSYPNSIDALTYSQANVMDFMYQFLSTIDPNKITIHRVLSNAVTQNSTAVIRHFLPKLTQEIDNAGIDYSDLRTEHILDIVNMTPKDNSYCNRHLSTLMQTVYLSIRHNRLNLVKVIAEETDIFYWPHLIGTAAKPDLLLQVEKLLEKKQLFKQLDNNIKDDVKHDSFNKQEKTKIKNKL